MRKKLLVMIILLGLIGCGTSCKKQLPQLPAIGETQEPVWAIEPCYEQAFDFSTGLALVTQNSKTFFIDKAGREKLSDFGHIVDRYIGESGFHNGVAVVDKDGIQQYLFRNGRIMRRRYSDMCAPVTNGNEALFLVEEDGLFGYLNSQDLWVVEPSFLDGEPFQNGFSVVRDERRSLQYLVSSEGTWIPVDCKYYITDIAEGFAAANSQKYISTATGKVVIPGPFEDTGPFSEGVAAVRENGKYGYINDDGQYTIRPAFKSADPFSCGLARVLLFSDVYAFVDHSGNVVFECGASQPADSFHEKTVIIHEKKGYGIADMHGGWVVEPQYDDILWDENGYYLLLKLNRKGSLIGLYNPVTEAKIDAQFDAINLIDMNDGLVTIEKDGQVGLASAITGEIIMEPFYDWDGNYGEGLISVRSSSAGQYGYINYSGEWIIAPQFDWAGRFSEGLAHVQNNNKHGYIANPLYYSSWDADEQKRANNFNFEVYTEGESTLSCEEFWTMLTMISDEINTDISAVPPEEVDMSQLLTRENAAILLTQYAKCIGECTVFFCSEYDDLSTLSENSKSSISYATSIGMFDIENERNTFCPEVPVNYGDAVKLTVRLAEYLFDTPQRKYTNNAMDVFSILY